MTAPRAAGCALLTARLRCPGGGCELRRRYFSEWSRPVLPSHGQHPHGALSAHITLFFGLYFFLFLFFNLNSCAFAVCFRQLFPWFSCLLQLTVQPKDYASTGWRLCRPLLSAAGSGDARGILNTHSPEAAVPAVPSGTALTAQAVPAGARRVFPRVTEGR